MEDEVAKRDEQGLSKLIAVIEKVGNKFPHPFWMFVWLIVIVFLLSALLSSMNVSVDYLAASRDPSQAPVEKTIEVKNLFNYETIRYITANFVSNYAGFAPLGLILIMMIAIGLAEQTGFLTSLIRASVLSMPPSLTTAIIALVGINANLASDAGVIIVPALGAAIFKAMGRNPWIGIITGYAAVNGGYGANFFIAATDVLLAGITQSVTDSMDITAPVHPLMNWYFMIVATFLLTIVTTFVTEKILSKYLGEEKGSGDLSALSEHALSPIEKKALKVSGVTAVVYVVFILALTLPQGSLFRNDDGGFLPRSPLISSIVSIIFFLFVALGITYGKTVGKIRQWADVPKLMQSGISDVLGFLVVALPAALFIYLFAESNIDKLIAVSGGQMLQKANFTGIPLILMFILFTSLINIFLTSGTAKWLILAPIFVPMFSVVGFSPALTQISYRVADSFTNIISPVDYYVPVIIGLLETYRGDSNRKVGIGTVISLCFPYALLYGIVLISLLIVWYIFNLPLGPGVNLFL